MLYENQKGKNSNEPEERGAPLDFIPYFIPEVGLTTITPTPALLLVCLSSPENIFCIEF